MKIPGAIIVEGHVQGLSNTRSLGEAGIPVYVVDKSDCIASRSKYCRKFFTCPDFQTDAFADFLIDLAQKEDVNGWVLIPSNDHAVYTLSRHKKRLSEYYKVISEDLEIVEKIYDKIKLLELARTLDVAIPATTLFTHPDDALPEELKFPVITKGRNGLTFYKTTGKKAFLASGKEEFKKQLELLAEKEQLTNSFTQELIPYNGKNKTISFTAFSVNGEIKAWWIGEKVREHPLRFGTATFARSIEKPELLEPSRKLLKALGYTGVCEIEYLQDPRNGQYKLIEINARTWLWVGLAKACGVDYAGMIYAYVNGQDYNYPDAYRIGVNWINPISDFAYSMFAMLQFKLSPFKYLGSVFARGNVNALISKGDNRPFFSYIFNIRSFLKSR